MIEHRTLPLPTSSAAPAAIHRARWVIRIMALALIALVAWANWATLTQITRVSGQLVTTAYTQSVQSADGGVLKQLLVHEGSIVKQGQVLAVLDASHMQSAVNDTSAKVAALQLALVRLSAEVSGQPMVIPAHLKLYADYAQNQLNWYRQRKHALDEELKALQATLQLSQQELSMNEPLLQTGDISRSDLIRLQRQVADIQAQISNRRNKYLSEAQAELTKVQEELRTQSESLADRTQTLGRTQLLSPCEGVVKHIKMHTIGGVLKPTEELMQIVPLHSELVIEAKIRPIDAAFVHVGSPVNIKLDAYDYTIFGSLQGKIDYLSADTLVEEGSTSRLNASGGGAPNASPTYYRARVRIQASRPQIEIKPGLTATIEIQTGQRSVWAYMTKPILKSWHQALSER